MPADPAPARDGLAPRVPIRARQTMIRPDLAARLVVKFVDDAGARARGGEAVIAHGETGTRVAAARHNISFSPLLRLPESELARLEQEAADRTREAQPDLASLMVASIPGADLDALRAAAAELE